MNAKTTELIMGVSLVVLGYALYSHFKKSGAIETPLGAIAFPRNDATKPDHGYGYDQLNPGDVLLSGDLTRGTVADYYAGQQAGYETPWTSDLIDSAVSDYYNVQSRPQSVVRQPGALW